MKNLKEIDGNKGFKLDTYLRKRLTIIIKLGEFFTPHTVPTNHLFVFRTVIVTHPGDPPVQYPHRKSFEQRN